MLKPHIGDPSDRQAHCPAVDVVKRAEDTDHQHPVQCLLQMYWHVTPILDILSSETRGQQSAVQLQEGGSLPDRGKAVMDNEVSQDMLADFEEQQQ